MQRWSKIARFQWRNQKFRTEDRSFSLCFRKCSLKRLLRFCKEIVFNSIATGNICPLAFRLRYCEKMCKYRRNTVSRLIVRKVLRIIETSRNRLRLFCVAREQRSSIGKWSIIVPASKEKHVEGVHDRFHSESRVLPQTRSPMEGTLREAGDFFTSPGD